VKTKLADNGLDFQTPLINDMTVPHPKPEVKQLIKVRRWVEAMIDPNELVPETYGIWLIAL
jgi:hypothetical protein